MAVKISKSERADKFRPDGTKPRRRFKPKALRHKKKLGPKDQRVKGK